MVYHYIEGGASPASFKAGEPPQFVIRLMSPGDRYGAELNSQEVRRHIAVSRLAVQNVKTHDERFLAKSPDIPLDVQTYGQLTLGLDPKKPDRAAQSFRLTPHGPLAPGEYLVSIFGVHNFELTKMLHNQEKLAFGIAGSRLTARAQDNSGANYVAVRQAVPPIPANGRAGTPPVISYAGKPLVQVLSVDLRGASLAFSPDSKVLATAAGNSARLWLTSSGTLLQTVEILRRTKSVPSRFPFLSPAPFLGFSRDSGTLEAGWVGEPGSLYDVRTGKVVGGFDLPTTPRGRVLSPDGKLMAAGNVSGTVLVEDSHTGQLLRTLQGHDGTAYAPVFSSDGKALASGGIDGSIIIWDTGTWAVLRTLRNIGSVYELRFSPNGKALAGWTGQDSVGLWEVQSGSLLQTILAHPGGVGPFDFSPDGAVLATAGTEDNAVKLWRWR
jgi:WD40 repeat protein